MTVGGAVGIALLLVLALVSVNQFGGETSAADEPIVAAPDHGQDVPASGRVKGDPNAPVTIVEWGDYQCPGCGQFYRETETQLIADYVSTGKATFEFRDMAFLGRESREAAEAALCADEQGKFWAMHDILYANQHGENEGAFDEDRLVEMAGMIGLDVDAFTSCMDDGRHEGQLDSMLTEARAAGINSTPTFVINGEMVTGGNYAALRETIEAALAGR